MKAFLNFLGACIGVTSARSKQWRAPFVCSIGSWKEMEGEEEEEEEGDGFVFLELQREGLCEYKEGSC